MTEPPEKKLTKTPWHQSVKTLIIAILVVGPLAIPLIWINRKFTLLLKLALTVLLISLSFFLFYLSSESIERLQSQLELLSEL